MPDEEELAANSEQWEAMRIEIKHNILKFTLHASQAMLAIQQEPDTEKRRAMIRASQPWMFFLQKGMLNALVALYRTFCTSKGLRVLQIIYGNVAEP
jgi:hypothetical protein